MNRERLFSRLDSVCYEALVDATALGRNRQHTFVDLDHWALCLLQRQNSDFSNLLTELGCDVSQMEKRLRIALGHMNSESDSVRDISPVLESCVAPAITWSQIVVPSLKVRSGHLLLAWLDDASIKRWLSKIHGLTAQVNLDKAIQLFEQHGDQWAEGISNPMISEANMPASLLDRNSRPQHENALSKWATSLTELVGRGELDPVVGRHDELRIVVDILLRRRQNNPILVGEAGVGKTAVVEALAQLIHDGLVPDLLKNAQVWSLDIIRMQAGAGVRGEFEQRLRTVIEYVAESEYPIILFCDEAHTLMGAGGAAGTGDAVNLLKPMLARGQLRMIAATTWSEFKQFIEPDSALTRRFQTVTIEEPNDANAIDMLRIIAPRFAKHHGVEISDAALGAAVKLSRRFLPTRQLPDKAISLLDTACARVAMSQSCAPQELVRLHHLQVTNDNTLKWRESDRRLGLIVDSDLNLLQKSAHLKKQVSELELSFENQRQKIANWLVALQSNTSTDQNKVDSGETVSPKDHLWVKAWVDEETIAQVISEWTGVPCAEMAQDDAHRWSHLETLLAEKIHGQQGAIAAISQALQVSRSGLSDPTRPLGVMFLAGPTGTGKSQTALALSSLLFGGEQNLIQFNMNEFQESHTVSTLKGAPPGYVGYGKGGRLTEAVRKKPYSVLLLDEFDRAHPDVHEIFYQVFDKGWMEDGEGRRINFRNCLILLTSNLGEVEITQACQNDPAISQSQLVKLVHARLSQKFPPALVGRMEVTAYRPLSLQALTAIAAQAWIEVGERIADLGLAWTVTEDVAPWVGQAVITHPSSARAVRDFLRQQVVPPIARAVLKAQADNQSLSGIRIFVDQKLCLDF